MSHLPDVELVDGEDALRLLEQPRLELVHRDVRRHRLQQDQRRLDQQRPHALNQGENVRDHKSIIRGLKHIILP